MSIHGASALRASHRFAVVAFFLAAALLFAAQSARATTPIGAPGKIAYGQYDGSQSDIYTINADATGKFNVTNTPSPLFEQRPTFSPTGALIAFARCDLDQCDIWTIKPDGSGGINLTKTATGSEDGPAYSPDGQSIAYTRADGMSPSPVWVMNPDGTNQHPLSDPGAQATDFEPGYSPDGTLITFTRCFFSPAGQCDLWVMNADGSNPHALTATASPVNELGGEFAPDGKRIVFQEDNVNDNLAIFNLDGSGIAPLTDTSPFRERRPVFSADQQRIAFHGTAGGVDDVYVADASGQGPVNITNSDGVEAGPAWETIQVCAGQRATIVGDDGPDVIRGTPGPDVIVANGGNDSVKGKAGRDLICGGAGKDKLKGGKGNDRLFGDAGKDSLAGGGGKDSCRGAKGRDSAKACEKEKGIP